jgi:hypothetical protein
MTGSSRVFVVNSSGHDFSAANKWGRIIPILEGNINIFRPDRMLHHIISVLQHKKFSCNDYLLLSGNSFGNSLICIAICKKLKLKKINLLVYNAKDHIYILHILDVDKLEFVRRKGGHI